MKRVSHVLILALICSCSNHHEMIGTWKAKKYTKWERGIAYLKGITGLVSGHELVLNSDSTFKLIGCGSFSIGKWYVKRDSLILNTDTTIWLDNKKHPLPTGIYETKRSSFLIEKNQLVSYYKGIGYHIDDKDSSIKYDSIYSLEILKHIY